MRKILKYPVQVEDNIEIELPVGAKILDVQAQRGEVFIWALVNPDIKEKQVRKFRVAGTGHPIEERDLEYIGTFQLDSGAFVGHLFEILKITRK